MKNTKRLLSLVLALVMVFALAACGGGGDAPATDAPATDAPATDAPATDAPAEGAPEEGAPAADALNADDIEDSMTSADGTYQIAFVTDVGVLKDKSFNQGTFDGVKLYAAANGKSYKYYQPANGDQATDDDRYDAMKAAVEGGAEVVVAAGFMQENALKRAASENPDVSFIFIDGYPVNDDNGNVLPNIAGISFCEEQPGYMAGYAVVKEGFEKLGFAGGGGGNNAAVNRYGYGFVQGANAAAAEMGKTVEINYTYKHGSNFAASPDLEAMIAGWYNNGTEIVFSAGGSIFVSIAAAASANDGYVIGVDVDQSSQSDTVILSAMKGLSSSVEWALTKVYDGTFDEIGGVGTALGAKEGAVGLPTDTWMLENYTVEEYEAQLEAIKAGTIEIDNTVLEYDAIAQDYSNVVLNYE